MQGNNGALKYDTTDGERTSNYRPGLIQAGERVKKDGSLPKNAREFHDKLYAVEMEGSGFAQSCLTAGLDWMVVRGIADHGDPRKRDKKQTLAAVAAACLLRQFLETTFQPPDVSDEIEF